MRGEISIRRCSITCSWPAVVSPSGELEEAPVPSGSGFVGPSLLRRRVAVVSPKPRQSVPWRLRISSSSVDGPRLFRLRASPWRRPSPSGPGLRVRRRIVARGCCWLFEIAPGVDEVLGTGGAVSGDVVGHAPGADGVRSERSAGDIQERHTELLLPGDEREGVADRRRRDRDSGLDDIVDGLLAINEEAINLGTGVDHRVVDMAGVVNGLAGDEAGVVYIERRGWDVETRLLSSIEKASGV